MPKVFVGTMYYNEGDYDECVAAIRRQRNVDVTHVIISNLPERIAHNQLWSAWRLNKDKGFDFFVKVDADTVLAHDDVLSEISKLFESNHRITGIQAPLHDYFTDSFINGLNCFTPKVVFQDTTDGLFCDRNVDVNHDIVVGSADVSAALKPAGLHCFHSSDEQAFHFGLHRALKRQTHTINLVNAAYNKFQDRKRRFALAGAHAADRFGHDGFNYSDKNFITIFEETLSESKHWI